MWPMGQEFESSAKDLAAAVSTRFQYIYIIYYNVEHVVETLVNQDSSLLLVHGSCARLQLVSPSQQESPTCCPGFVQYVPEVDGAALIFLF